MTVRWTPIAAENLTAVYDYLAQDNERAARTTVEEILKAVDRLEQFPRMGREGRRRGTRELVVPPFIVVYRIHEDVVAIDAILHSSRRL